MNRRQFLQRSAVVATAATGFSAFQAGGKAGASHPRPFVAYSASSFHKSTVTGAPIDAALTAEFINVHRSHPDQVGSTVPDAPALRGTGGNSWGTAYSMGNGSDPVWKLAPGGTLPAVCADLRTIGFRADAGLGDRFTGTSDSPFIVIDRITGQTVWGAQAEVVGPNLIGFSAAGRFKHGTNGLDRRNPLSDGPQNERSRGVIPDGMAIRRDLLDWAVEVPGRDLGHVLGMFIVESDSARGFVHPMVGYESGKSGFGAEGTRVALKPSANIAGYGLSPYAAVIAQTLKKRGACIHDNSGTGTGLKLAMDGQSWAGLLDIDSLAAIPWEDWVVIQPGWPG